MTKEDILAEIAKENPDWLAISSAAKSIYESSKESSLGFLRGHINIVKVAEHSVGDMTKELGPCMPDAEILSVGGWAGMTVTKFNKLMPSLKDKFVVVVTDKPQVVANVSKEGMCFRQFSATMKNRWDKSKPTMVRLKGEGIDIKAEVGSLKAAAREMMLEKILE